MHAAIEAARLFNPTEEHPNLVLCGIPDEMRLVVEKRRVEQASLPCFPFYESDMDGELTAIAVGPLREEADRRLLRKHNLLTGDALCGRSPSNSPKQACG